MDCGVLESGEGWCRPSSSWPELGHQRTAATPGRLLLGDQRVGGQQQSRDRRAVLQGRATDPQGIDDPHVDHVPVATLEGVEALVDAHLRHLGDHLVAEVARVGRDQVRRLGERAAHDLHAGRVVVLDVELVEHRRRVHQRDAAAGHDALGHRGAGRGQGVLDPVLQLGQLGVGGCADLDHGDLARQRADPLAEHLLVDPEGGPLRLGAQLRDPELDLLGVAGAADDGGPVGGDPDLPGPAELRDGHRLEGEAGVLAVDLAAGDRGDVLELAQPPVAEARAPWWRRSGRSR